MIQSLDWTPHFFATLPFCTHIITFSTCTAALQTFWAGGSKDSIISCLYSARFSSTLRLVISSLFLFSCYRNLFKSKLGKVTNWWYSVLTKLHQKLGMVHFCVHIFKIRRMFRFRMNHPPTPKSEQLGKKKYVHLNNHLIVSQRLSTACEKKIWALSVIPSMSDVSDNSC